MRRLGQWANSTHWLLAFAHPDCHMVLVLLLLHCTLKKINYTSYFRNFSGIILPDYSFANCFRMHANNLCRIYSAIESHFARSNRNFHISLRVDSDIGCLRSHRPSTSPNSIWCSSRSCIPTKASLRVWSECLQRKLLTYICSHVLIFQVFYLQSLKKVCVLFNLTLFT